MTPRTNYIFIDYDHQRNIDVPLLKASNARLIVILGQNAPKMPTPLVLLKEARPEQVNFIQMEGSGPNALDSVLAFEVGQRAAADPKGFFHIVSKDKGFDALVTHLKGKKIFSARHDAFTDIKFLTESFPKVPSLPPPPSKKDTATASPVDCITKALAKSAKNRPARESKLRTYIGNRIKEIAPSEVDQTITALKKTKILTIDQSGKITYLG